MTKWVKTINDKKVIEKERLKYNINMSSEDSLYQFMLELQPTEVNSYQLNELVKCYKDITKSDEERKDISLEIFRACFKMLYFYSVKNTYTKKSYNDGDIIFGMWQSFEYLLDKFEFKVYKDKNGVQEGRVLSFRNYLKKFYGAKFHRFNYQSSKFGTCPLTDLIWKSHNKIQTSSLDAIEDSATLVTFNDKEIVDIEYSDSIGLIKEELIDLIREDLSEEQANFMLYKFKLTTKRYRYKRELYDYDNMLVVSLGILRRNKRVKELFELMKEYNSEM